MIKKQRLILAVVLIAVALVGLAGWGYARPAVASPEREQSEGKSFRARNHAADGLHRWTREHGFSRVEGRDEESDDLESDDRADSNPTTAGLTTTTTAGGTTAGATTTTTGATTTTTGATTTTTGATTTTTGATTTTTGATTTTTGATTTTINAAPLFAAHCAGCHGPTPITSTQATSIYTRITTGNMSSYASSLSDPQRLALANYVAGGGR